MLQQRGPRRGGAGPFQAHDEPEAPASAGLDSGEGILDDGRTVGGDADAAGRLQVLSTYRR